MTNENMPERELNIPKDLERAVVFHGHLCGGLALGYRASLAGLRRLNVNRAEDEDLVAIVETDSCTVDAVQFMTGCTFGKGNLIFRDHGKNVFTFARRSGGKAVRVALKSWPGKSEEESSKGEGKTDAASQPRGGSLQLILDVSEDSLFTITEVELTLPPRAQIRQSIACDSCGEPVMVTRIQEKGGRRLCIPCADSN